MADDWDLQAVVRGCAAATSSSSSSSSTATAVSSSSCSPDVYSQSFFQPQEDRFQFFPDPLEPYGRSENVEELHDLFKPFYPRLQPLSPQSNPISSISFLRGLQDLSPSPPLPPPAPPQKEEKQRQKQPLAGTARIIAAGTSIASSANTPSPRSKRRKNQLKRVCHVPSEGLSSDMWSWRKYGQKPIKGSPYPRGYYRCSTSKGCLARKQVERDRSDPGMFIVTYTGEHNHPMPTHRNSLAGSTRQKPVTPQTTTTSEGDPTKASCSPPVSPTSLSPATEKLVSREEREVDLVEDEEDELGVSDMVISDDFFEGLEELNGLATGDCFPDHLPVCLPFPWMANSATTTAAGGG